MLWRSAEFYLFGREISSIGPPCCVGRTAVTLGREEPVSDEEAGFSHFDTLRICHLLLSSGKAAIFGGHS